MKKIIALILIAVTALSLLAGCKKTVEGVDEVNECYARSYPHKIYVKSTQQVGTAVPLVSETTIARGTVGASFVAIKKAELESYRSIEEGSGDQVLGNVKRDVSETWYKEGSGTTVDKGASWDEAGENFFPAKGALATFELNTELMENVEFKDGRLNFTVANSNAKAFFGDGMAIAENIKVSIATAGGVVTEVVISWTEPKNNATGVDMTAVEIVTTYTYDQQRITLE